MGSVSERIHDGHEIVRNAGIDLHDIGCREAEILGECSVTVHAHSDGVLADVLAAPAAVAAMTAGDMAFSGHAVSDLVVLDTAAQLHNLADILVTDGHWGLDRVLGPLIPVVDVEVSTANGYFPNLDKNVIYTDFRHRDIFHPDSRFSILLYKCFHCL